MFIDMNLRRNLLVMVEEQLNNSLWAPQLFLKETETTGILSVGEMGNISMYFILYES